MAPFKSTPAFCISCEEVGTPLIIKTRSVRPPDDEYLPGEYKKKLHTAILIAFLMPSPGRPGGEKGAFDFLYLSV